MKPGTIRSLSLKAALLTVCMAASLLVPSGTAAAAGPVLPPENSEAVEAEPAAVDAAGPVLPPENSEAIEAEPAAVDATGAAPSAEENLEPPAPAAGPARSPEENLAAAEAAAVLADGVLDFSEIRARLENYNAEYINTYRNYVSSSLDLGTARELAEEAGRFMEDARDVYSEDMAEEDRALYESYKETARELRKLAQDLSGDELPDSVKKSLKQALDTKEQLAQNQYIEYEKARYALPAASKSAEVQESLYETAKVKREAGLIGEAELITAEKNMYAAQKQREARQAALDNARANLLMLLGYDPAQDIAIAEIGGITGDLADQANPEEDKKTAIASNRNLASIRRQKSKGNSARTQKSRSVAYTMAEIESSMDKYYADLTAKKLLLDGQKMALEKAGAAWRAAGTKHQSGMMARSDYLQAEAAYLSAVSQEKSAELDFYRSWLTYRWAIRGMM